ncbi:MAG: hypothetical protein HY721_11265 [Planctomycetes bacterium]|nr:hypothetical protein [Planctomycetota bacterium]
MSSQDPSIPALPLRPATAARASISCALLLAALSAGCSPIAYKANDGLAKEVGVEEAKKRLKELVHRAQATGGGVVTSVDVTDESLKVKSQQSTVGVFYQLETRQLENEVYFAALDRVDLYSNNWAYVYASGGRLVLQVLLPTPEEARTFADLVTSLAALRRGR